LSYGRLVDFKGFTGISSNPTLLSNLPFDSLVRQWV